VGALLRSDALVSGGGGLLQDATSARSLAYYLGVLRAARLLGKRAAVYGQSLGPLTPAGRQRVARALRGVPAFWRDEASRSLARELGLDDRTTADAALLLAPEEPAGADPDGPVLLVPRAGHPAHNQALARLARSLAGEGVPVAAVALHAGHDDAEVAALRRAAPGVEAWSAPTAEELLDLLPRASFVVSARLHGCVLAAAAGVGFAALTYDPKVAGFAALLGAPAFAAPVDDDALLAAARARPALDLAARGAQVRLAREGVAELVRSLGA
jgi:polysaccharide pyruvyl transferase CsaB